MEHIQALSGLLAIFGDDWLTGLLQFLEFRLQHAHIDGFGASLKDIVGLASRGRRLQLQRAALRTNKVDTTRPLFFEVFQ